jgi:hypothetical protein
MDAEIRKMIQETHDSVTEMKPMLRAVREEQATQGERVRDLELKEREIEVRQVNMEEDVQKVGGVVEQVSGELQTHKEDHNKLTEDRFWKMLAIVMSAGGLLLGLGHLAIAVVRTSNG